MPGPISFSRRQLLAAGGLLALGMSSRTACAGLALPSTRTAPPTPLLRRAMAAFERHRGALTATDRMGIVDYRAHSREPRFHILDIDSGRSRALLVAHGRGSDPGHSGLLQRFSNRPGSLASSAGAYLTGPVYSGRYGEARRLVGLEARNSNAEARAIVIHRAWYVGDDIVAQQGKLGRSEGCFAFSESDIDIVLDQLGAGRLIYADKVAPDPAPRLRPAPAGRVFAPLCRT